MTDYGEEQRNELEALESIYPDSFTGDFRGRVPAAVPGWGGMGRSRRRRRRPRPPGPRWWRGSEAARPPLPPLSPPVLPAKCPGHLRAAPRLLLRRFPGT